MIKKSIGSRISLYLSGILIFVISFVVYFPSLSSEFVWDDVINIEKKYYQYQNLDISSIFIPRSKEVKKGAYFRPLIHLSIVLDYKNWGHNPLGYHLTNNLLFSLSSVLFFFLTILVLREFNILDKELIACIATIIYIVHPMHIESVSWISGRTDIICTIFFVSAFITHILSYKRVWLIPLTLLLFLLSFLSKEIAVAFPFVAISYDLLKSKELKVKNIYISLFYLSLLIILLLIRGREYDNLPDISPLRIGKDAEDSLSAFDYLKVLQVTFNSYLYYFYKLVLPIKFNALITDFPKTTYYTIISIFVFIGLSVASFFSIRRKTGLKAFALLWLVLTLFPSVLVSVIKLSTTPIAERYLFLPSCSFSLLVAYLIYPYFSNPKYKKYLTVILLFVFCALLYLNVDRQSVWKNRIAFWTDVSKKTTDSAVPHINLGMALIEKGELNLAVEILEKSLGSGLKAPSILKSVAANNLGIAYMNGGLVEVAERWFLKGIEYNYRFHKSYYHLGLINFNLAEDMNSPELLKKSERYFLTAIEFKQNYGRAYLFLAHISMMNNDYAKAEDYARKSLGFGLIEPLDKQAEGILKQIGVM